MWAKLISDFKSSSEKNQSELLRRDRENVKLRKKTI